MSSLGGKVLLGDKKIDGGWMHGPWRRSQTFCWELVAIAKGPERSGFVDEKRNELLGQKRLFLVCGGGEEGRADSGTAFDNEDIIHGVLWDCMRGKKKEDHEKEWTEVGVDMTLRGT